MSLPDSFWRLDASDVPPVERVYDRTPPDGHWYLDVVFRNRDDAIGVPYHPEAIWNDGNLREMDLGFRTPTCDKLVISVTPDWWNTPPGHRVRPNSTEILAGHAMSRMEAVGRLLNTAGWRRMVPNIPDLAFILARWWPDPSCAFKDADTWWEMSKGTLMQNGLQTGEVAKVQYALAMVEGTL